MTASDRRCDDAPCGVCVYRGWVPCDEADDGALDRALRRFDGADR